MYNWSIQKHPCVRVCVLLCVSGMCSWCRWIDFNIWRMQQQLVPPWLEKLLGTAFFSVCRTHGAAARSECNMYCLDCNGDAFCFYCRSSRHKEHQVIQVRVCVCVWFFLHIYNRQSHALIGCTYNVVMYNSIDFMKTLKFTSTLSKFDCFFSSHFLSILLKLNINYVYIIKNEMRYITLFSFSTLYSPQQFCFYAI